MRALLLLVRVVVPVGGALKLAGVRLPVIADPIGPIGVAGSGPRMPNVHVESPGFGDFPAP